ncbi:NAD(P)/FAD-dependent oxidoreductase [Pararhodobacter zhoushanensis]|uniref:NAD(P)/FAD-dependent oxidoreductase n=1 Tax=Pararhodobacter zhoushanensis TaxID=2479545 RepID=UPI000F8EB3CF|nr:FAD-dependent oxidoreductase [Pararhodobacter zhoushanensis]
MRIAVIGGGILGASVGWHLAQGGARVTVFHAAAPGATEGSFAWINASLGNDPAYRRLRVVSMAAWPRLAAAAPGTGFQACGGLMWDAPEAELRAYVAGTEGYPLRLVDADEARALEPALRQPPALAVHAPGEGMVEPVAAAAALRRGLEVVRSEVALVEVKGRAALRVAGAVRAYDAVVLAAGAASAGLLAPLGLALSMHAPLGMLAWSRPVARLLNGLVMMPDMHIRQTDEGRIVLGEDYGGADPGIDAEAKARAMLALASERLDGPALIFNHVTLAGRPTPGDGRPAVGALAMPGLWLALSHSGVTLAPAIGAMLATQMLTGARDPLLDPYAPDRLVQLT